MNRNLTQERVVEVPYESFKLSTRVVKVRVPSARWMIFLNGAGVGLSKDRFLTFQNAFADVGVNSLSFDYVGTGLSGGAMSESSLDDRIAQVHCILQWLRDTYGEPSELGIYGVSMGTYAALGVTVDFPDIIQKLFLVTGAAYASRAHKVNFGPDFTAILRENGKNGPSWKDSLSFQWIERTKADILLVVAEQDEIVPRAISERYRDIARARTIGKSEYIILPGATHYIGRSGEEVALAPKLIDFYNS